MTMNMSYHAAHAELAIMSGLGLYDRGEKVVVENKRERCTHEFTRSEDGSWGRSMLVRTIVGDLLGLYGVKTCELLCKMIGEGSDADAHSNCEIVLSKRLEADRYRSEFVSNFDRSARAAEYIADGLTPRGDVHYRIEFNYDSYKGIYTSHRTIVCGDMSYWAEDGLWFDYYGPEENDLGLIPYVDY